MTAALRPRLRALLVSSLFVLGSSFYVLPFSASAQTSLAGRVTDPDGRPVVNAELIVTGNAAAPLRARSGDDGRFEIAGLVAGRYRVIATAPGLVSDAIAVEAPGSLDITLRISAVTETLVVSAAQIGALEIHIWGAHWKTIEHPDRLVFDLDPDGGVTFADVRAAARDVRALLQGADLESFALFTGGKGIHVVVPLDASQSWEEVKAFAKGVATRIAETEPDRFTATMSKAKRKGRIFIDWLRNQRGATAILPYSARARAHAPVAAPVSWTELRNIHTAARWTIADAAELLDRAGSAALAGWGIADQALPDL